MVYTRKVESPTRMTGYNKPIEARKTESDQEFFVELLGRHVPTMNTEAGLRSLNNGKEDSAESLKKYLKSKFADDLEDAHEAIEDLAKAHKPKDLADRAFGLYEKFRPNIPSGAEGWGAKGKLDLDYIRSLAK